MKKLSLSEVSHTLAHDNLMRQQFIKPGDVKTSLQTVNFVTLAQGQSFTPHAHPDCEEYFFVIEGEAQAIIAGEKTSLTKGDFLVVEAEEEHVFTNVSEITFVYFQFRILL